MTDTSIQFGLFDQIQTGYWVAPIEKTATHPFLLHIHYAKRIPPISYAFGLFHNDDLVGVITYGMPASPALCKGVCGETYRDKVIELNRLCLRNNIKNEASRLIAGSLKLLPQPKIVVSYADTAHDHNGVVYQATNFLYTGLSNPHRDWAVRGKENAHLKGLSNGQTLKSMQEQYGDDFYYIERSRKHRYIMFLGSKTEKKQMLKMLNYPISEYPKVAHDD